VLVAVFGIHDLGMNARGLGVALEEHRSFTWSGLITQSSAVSRFD